jgi:alkylated DNA repair dioxygenase AlkB
VDCEPCFGETIISLTLGSGCTMEFSHRPSRQKRELWLEPGSLLVLQGAARHEWKHAIPPRKTDMVAGQRMERATRVSLTFRSVILSAPLACAI